MSSSHISRIASGAALFCLTGTLHAQTSALEPVTVTATRVERNIDEIPAAVSSVSGEDIQAGQEQLGIDESLNGIPGLFLLNRYNFAQDTRASIRGAGARSSFGIRGIKIIVDGIPETLADGQGSVDGIDLGAARQIDVIRGPASSLYGNASGGAIIIQGERGPDEPFISARTLGGEFGLRNNQLKAGGENNGFNWLFNANDTSVDGYRDNSEAENTQLSGRVQYDLSPRSTLLAVIHHTDQPTANDPGGITAEDAAADPTQARDRNLEFRSGEALEQTRLGLVYNTELTSGRSMEARVYQTDREFNNRLPFEGGGAVFLDRSFSGAGLKYTHEGNLGSRSNRTLVGIDYDRQDDDRRRFDNLRGVPGEQTLDQNELVTATGLYLQNETALTNRLDLTLGARYDEITFDVTDRFQSDGDDSGKVTLDQISPMIGISYQVRAGLRAYSTISTAFETPTTTEFANPNGGGFNQSLAPQETTNYEIGIKSTSSMQSFELAIFHIDVEDELTPFERSDQPGRQFFENAGASDRDGVELAWQRKLGGGVTVDASWTWSDFKFEQFRNADGDEFDGNRLPGVPEHLGYLGLSWYGNSGFHASVDALYTGELFADNANETEVDSSLVSSLRLGYDAFVGDWEISPFLGVNNLTDEDYNSNIRINAFGSRYFEPAPERNGYIGISVRRNFP